MTIIMTCAGGVQYRDGITNLQTQCNDILGVESGSGILRVGHHAGISFCLDKKRLERTVRSIYGEGISLEQGTPRVTQGISERIGGNGTSLLFGLFGMIDSLLHENQVMPAEMALDDQIYKAYAVTVARSIHGDQLNTRLGRGHVKADALNDLTDYIISHSGNAITLTDLEEQSHYSARHLQHLFREKFDCTPMQFVRRQRLNAAMEKLQEGSFGNSVTRIARDCGYRFTSNFSSDFHRQFGVAPSVVLRASRGTGTPRHP